MNLLRIEYFMKVAQCLNFTMAAQLLFITQPALSRQIALFEKEIGVELFDRTRKTLKLTEAGKILLAELEKINIARFNKQIHSAINKAKSEADRSKNIISLGCVSGINIGSTVSRTLMNFASKFSNVTFNIIYSDFRSLNEKLMDGSIDVAVTLSFHLGEFSDISYLKLEQRRHYVTMSINHKLANEKKLKLEDLKNETFLLLEEAVRNLDLLKPLYHKDTSFKPTIKYLPNNETILKNIEFGLGISFYDKSIGETRAGKLKFVPYEESEEFYLVCVWRKDNPNKALPLFIELLMNKEVL